MVYFWTAVIAFVAGVVLTLLYSKIVIAKAKQAEADAVAALTKLRNSLVSIGVKRETAIAADFAKLKSELAKLFKL